MDAKAAVSRRRLRRFMAAVSLLVLARVVWLIYAGFPQRALERVDEHLKKAACAAPDSSAPPDDEWRRANAEVLSAGHYPGFRDEVSRKDRDVLWCCANAYRNACEEARRRATERAHARPPAAREEDFQEIMRRDPRDFTTPEERRLLCGGGPFRECGGGLADDGTLCPELCPH